MRKLAITALSVLITVSVLAQQGRLFDQPMKIKQMNVRVSSDCFTATTFIEIEFFNKKDQEVEGAYFFRLQPGQVISNLQLELDGKYRDGSIEERWKAANAYNTIVGKRIDPALLQHIGGDQYKLSIYPVPARSSRKITFTIHQLLNEQNGMLSYKLPIEGADSIANLSLSIKTSDCYARPIAAPGFLANDVFSANGKGYDMARVQKNIKLPVILGFSIPTRGEAVMRVKETDGRKFFALRFNPQKPVQKQLKPKNITVYWDVSLSAANRNRQKDMEFLKKYMSEHAIETIIIVPFSNRRGNAIRFSVADGNKWERYLQSLLFEGGTRFDNLDLKSHLSDAIFIFSDGKRTAGGKHDGEFGPPVFTVSSSYNPDSISLKELAGTSGGTYIDIYRSSITEAIVRSSVVQVDLMNIEALSRHTTFEATMNGTGSTVLVYGTFKEDDNILVRYGNSTMQNTDLFRIHQEYDEGSGIDRIGMLVKYPRIMQSGDWNLQLDFGLEERVVTMRTSFIVLERVEDYVRYNISPPKELEEACKAQGFVKKSTKELREQEKIRQEFNNLLHVVNGYSKLLLDHGITKIPVTITEDNFATHQQSVKELDKVIEPTASSQSVPVTMRSDNLEEVVVTTAYGIQRKQSGMGSAITKVSNRELTQARSVNVQGGLSGKVSGLNVTTMNNGVFEDSRLTLRGIRSLTGNNQPLLVYDGSTVPLRYLNEINPNDVEDVTVLKGATGAALYGSEGVNGVILVTSKKHKNSTSYKKYKLRDMPEEEYIQQLQNAPVSQKIVEYVALKKVHGHKPLFYVEVAQHLNKHGLKEKAKDVLLNAAEVAGNDLVVMRAIAFVMEGWGDYEDALSIYSQLHMDHEIVRDMAWCYYQMGRKQEAVDFLFESIRTVPLDLMQKAYLADDMNAMIAINKEIVTNKIPKELLIAKPVDLRVVLSSNSGTFGTMEVQVPGVKAAVTGSENQWDYYRHTMNIEQFSKATNGKYKVTVRHYDWNGTNVPMLIKMMVFKNFGKPDQTIEIENIIMNNQSGHVEIAEVKW